MAASLHITPQSSGTPTRGSLTHLPRRCLLLATSQQPHTNYCAMHTRASCQSTISILTPVITNSQSWYQHSWKCLTPAQCRQFCFLIGSLVIQHQILAQINWTVPMTILFGVQCIKTWICGLTARRFFDLLRLCDKGERRTCFWRGKNAMNNQHGRDLHLNWQEQQHLGRMPNHDFLWRTLSST